MFVVYRKDTLLIDQLVYTAGPEFMAALAANDAFGVIETSLEKGPNEIAVILVGGNPRLVERQPFPFTVPATGKVGVELRLTGVPTDTVITTESSDLTMVKSGILDMTFDVAGTYDFFFTHPLYMPRSASIEVSA